MSLRIRGDTPMTMGRHGIPSMMNGRRKALRESEAVCY